MDHRDIAIHAVPLRWADSLPIESDSGRKIIVHPNSREIIVKKLYPRLMYTFSDVVCYVTNNPRSVLIAKTLYTPKGAHSLILEQRRMNLITCSSGLRLATNEQSTSV